MNTPEELFHTLLGLGDEWEITELEFDQESGEVRLRIEDRPGLLSKQRCPTDKGEASLYDHGREREWRHMDVFEHKCYIQARLPRVPCKDCGKIYQVQAPWEGLSLHFTAAFEAMALLLMREMPVKKAGEIIRESDTRLWRILARHVAVAYEQLDFSKVSHLGVDELAARKGHKYLTIFADMIAKRVLYAVPGRDSATWKAFVKELKKHSGNRKKIKCVSMDMSVPYQKGVADNCPNAEVVFDKFHLIAKANEAVNKVRKAEIRRGGKYNELKETRWLWLKNPDNLTEKQIVHMERIDKENLVTAIAYQMRLCLQDVYLLPTEERAESRLLAWCRWVRQKARQARFGLLAAMVKVANCIENHLVGILKYWDQKITNAYMEGMNNMFQMVKRRARGYRNDQNFIMMIYFVGSKLTLPTTTGLTHSK
ncbi:MAG: ISL3 family transposase [Verrucomicrobia bacterium]|nr:ISL3 family transposase [Verrucomicrobiota bacterium]